jgi:hypothetical protein
MISSLQRITANIIFCTVLLLSNIFTPQTFPQDTSKVKIKNDTTAQQEILISESKFLYLNMYEPDTITRNRILWFPLKSTEDIFNYLPGYYLNFMDVGQINRLNYDQLDQHYSGVFRNSRPINDLLDGSIDFNLFSKNEIAEIEQTDGFGNFLYNYDNGINIISKQVFQFRPYSEISYLQDRFNNLYFDGNFHQNFFKHFNFNFGITKHSYDGNYLNSSFDKWLGRFNINYFPKESFNVSLNGNYAKINRGLNEGIDPSQIPDLSKQTLFENAIDLVRKPDASESKERFDIDLTFLKTYGKKKNSFSKLQFFTSNSFRKYGATGFLNDSTSFLIRDNSHWIDYGVKLHQTLNFKLINGLDFISKTEFEYDKDYIYTSLNPLNNSERTYFLEDAGFDTKYISLTAYAKAYRFAYYQNKFFYDFGLKPTVKVFADTNFKADLYGQYTNSNRLPTYQEEFLKQLPTNAYSGPGNEKNQFIRTGLYLNYKGNELTFEYYHNTIKDYLEYSINPDLFIINALGQYSTYGFNSKLNLSIYHFDLHFNLSNNNGQNGGSGFYPKWNGNAMLAYHNIFFKKNLEVEVGLNSRFWDNYTANYYNGLYNDFTDRLKDTVLSLYSDLKIKRDVTLDFFVIGKIDKAVFGLTFENILNRPLMTTAIYPYQQRGGLFNVMSRFNITWYFLN